MTSWHQEPVDRNNPALVLFLVDQSASMAEPAGGQSGHSKAHTVADAINRLIQQLLLRCCVGNEIVDRIYFGVIGYNDSLHPGFGGALQEQLVVPTSQMENNPLRIETRVKKVNEGAGALVEQKVRFPVWLEPVALGRSSMRLALEAAKGSVAEFVGHFPESFPPIVINITGGFPVEAEQSDFTDVEAAAHSLKSIVNRNGSNTLLFNIYISSEETTPISFPIHEGQVSDRLSKLLFRTSSPLSDEMCRVANARDAQIALSAGARGFIFQGDPAAVLQVLNLDIGTRVGGNLEGETPKTVVRAEVRDATKPPIRVDDNVQFTVYRPKSIRPAKWYPLAAYAHLDALPADADKDEPEPLKAVQADAARTFGAQLERFANTTQDSSHSVPRDGELTFVPEMKGAEFNPARQTIRWVENYHRVDFRIRSSSEHDGETLRGRMSVFLGAILLAEIALRIKVDSSAEDNVEKAPQETVTAPRYRKIFASYSHRDLAIVKQFEKYVETLGDRYLRDWKELRSGEQWNDRLLEMIEEADVFQLFWSRNSMQSPFVRREWEHALKLKHKGPCFIRPTYWEEPFPNSSAESLPPSELLEIQFTKLGAAPTTHGPVAAHGDVPDSSDPADESTTMIAQGDLQHGNVLVSPHADERQLLPHRIDEDGAPEYGSDSDMHLTSPTIEPDADEESELSLTKVAIDDGSDVSLDSQRSGTDWHELSDSGLSLADKPLDPGGSGVNRTDLSEDENAVALDNAASDCEESMPFEADNARVLECREPYALGGAVPGLAAGMASPAMQPCYAPAFSSRSGSRRENIRLQVAILVLLALVVLVAAGSLTGGWWIWARGKKTLQDQETKFTADMEAVKGQSQRELERQANLQKSLLMASSTVSQEAFVAELAKARELVANEDETNLVRHIETEWARRQSDQDAPLAAIVSTTGSPDAYRQQLTSYVARFPTTPRAADFTRVVETELPGVELFLRWNALLKQLGDRELRDLHPAQAQELARETETLLPDCGGFPEAARLQQRLPALRAIANRLQEGVPIVDRLVESLDMSPTTIPFVAVTKGGIRYYLSGTPKRQDANYSFDYFIDARMSTQSFSLPVAELDTRRSGKLGHAPVSLAMLKSLARLNDSNWEDTFVRIACDIQAEPKMEPIIKVRWLRETLELGSRGSEAFSSSFAAPLKMLQQVQVPDELNWLDPENPEVQSVRRECDNALAGLDNLVAAGQQVAARLAESNTFAPAILHRWAGCLLRDETGKWRCELVPNGMRQGTATVAVVVKAEGGLPQLQKIATLDAQSVTFETAALPTLLEGRPVFLNATASEQSRK